MKKTFAFTLLIFSLFIFSACSNQQVAVNDKENSENLNYNSMNIFPESFKDLYYLGYNQAIIKTNQGEIKVKLYGEKSPDTVNNFLNLADQGFYDGLKFHRVIKDFMIQAGCPHTKTDQEGMYGTGGPGYSFPDEINNEPLVLGSLAMANSGPNTNGSQFFIVTAQSTPWLDGGHTNFGEVVEGMEVVKAIEDKETKPGDIPVDDIIIEKIEIIND